jgi:cytochrome c oxidase subunit 2
MRRVLARCVIAGVVGAGGGYLAAAVLAGAPSSVALTASKYEFSRTEIKARKGQPVTFSLSTSDFPHGFSLPDFGVRADLVPGKTIEVTFTPDKVGRFVFLCDNFCGDEHDRMTGFLVVSEE